MYGRLESKVKVVCEQCKSERETEEEQGAPDPDDGARILEVGLERISREDPSVMRVSDVPHAWYWTNVTRLWPPLW